MKRILKWIALFLLAIIFQSCATVTCKVSTNVRGEAVAIAVVDEREKAVVCGPCGDKSVPPEGFHTRRAFSTNGQCEATLADTSKCVLLWREGQCSLFSAYSATQSPPEE